MHRVESIIAVEAAGLPVVLSPRALPERITQRAVPQMQDFCRESLDGNFQMGEKLGSGASATVHIATYKSTGKPVAVKTYYKSHMDKVVEGRIRKEYALMRHMNHPNLIKLIDVVENPEQIIIIMELASSGDLHHFITSQPQYRLSEDKARIIFKQIAKGVRHLHRCGFVHRDIKLENILLDGDKPRAVIADLGYGTIWSTKEVTNTPCGSLYFAAPEIVSNEAYVGPEIDIWSLGVVLYTITSGALPFLNESDDITIDLIIAGHYIYRTHWSADLKDLISSMLKTHQKNRITIEEVIKHPWVQANKPEKENKKKKKKSTKIKKENKESKEIQEKKEKNEKKKE